MNKVLPTLDLLAHNAIAALIIAAVIGVLSHLAVLAVQRIAAGVLRSAVFASVTAEERDELRKRIRRRALASVLVVAVLLLGGALVASLRGLRALDLVRAAIAWALARNYAALRSHLPVVLGIVIGAVLASEILRSMVAAIGRGLARWPRLEAQRDALPAVIGRARAAVRAVVLCSAAVYCAQVLEVSTGARLISLAAAAIGAVYVGRAASRLWQLATDVVFGLSARLAGAEGLLKALANLMHLKDVTRRTGDYIIYVGGATWVAGRIASDAWYFSAGQIGLRLIIIFYASRVLVELCIVIAQELFLGKPEGHSEAVLQQRRTLFPVLRGILRYGIYFMALIMCLKEISIDPTPLLAGAGVLGVAIGFGAQTFVGDIVAGFFILFEELVLVGDLVEIDAVKGRVEEIGVRITRIRDDAGVLHSIPNGAVRKVANHSRQYVNAVVDVYVPYEEDPRRVRALLLLLADKVLEEEGLKRGPSEVKVQELGEGSILLRLSVRVPPGQDEDVGDVLRARIVEELRAAKVGAPRPRRAVIIDSALAVSSPEGSPGKAEEDEGPPEPLKPGGGD